jgi:hypothetical protein
MNRRDIHPTWCGQGHVCSADRPAGEHRSSPVILHGRTATLVATRTRTVAGRDRLEIRAVIDLPADPTRARAVAQIALQRMQAALAGANPGGGAR